MFNKNLLLFLFTFTIAHTNAQELHYFSGSKIEEFDPSTFQLYSQDSSTIYAFRFNSNDYFLEGYDKATLTRLFHIRTPLPAKDSLKYHFESLLPLNDSFLVLYSYFNKRNLREQLEMVTFDKNGNTLNNGKMVDFSEGKNEKHAGNFSVIPRKNMNEFLAFGTKIFQDTTFVTINHFDYFGNRTRSQKFSLDDESGNIVHSLIDRECNLYHLTRSKLANRNVKWNIIIYKPDTDLPIKIALQKPSATKIYLSNIVNSYIDLHDRINIIIPYSTQTPAYDATGIYLAQLDSKTNSLISENFIPFKLDTGNVNDDNGFMLSACINVGIIPMKNDALKLVYESRKSTTTYLYGIPVSTEYDLGNIITMDLDSNHVVSDIHKIRKQQHSNKYATDFIGLAILSHADKSYFIYNELEENLTKTPDNMKQVNASKMEKTNVIYSVVENGKVLRKPIIKKENKKDIDAIILSTHLHSNNGDELYLPRKINQQVFLTKFYFTDN